MKNIIIYSIKFIVQSTNWHVISAYQCARNAQLFIT